ncbi:MAG: hypothetical protein DME19_13000 [Verrucomicrobia bacterium]|nr:MAG: hypothetical protein DME19_13000 [Verrucomicrobiota bacterium]
MTAERGLEHRYNLEVNSTMCKKRYLSASKLFVDLLIKWSFLTGASAFYRLKGELILLSVWWKKP